MTENKDMIKDITVDHIFDEKYEVPIYQRNYSWDRKQIEQLIDDIWGSFRDLCFGHEENYYIGTLIVNRRGNLYEVVDGQQRLTTLFLLLSYLGMPPAEDLRFEARNKSNWILKAIRENTEETADIDKDHEISRGLQDIRDIFQDCEKNIDEKRFQEKLKKVHIVRVQVPENVDLNHYFEIMNTRGEPLELHEKAKSKFMSEMNAREKETANLIWEACANMDSYLHMNLPPSCKRIILKESRDELALGIDSFDSLVERLHTAERKSDRFSLSDFFENPWGLAPEGETPEWDEEERGSNRFESIIRFPQFLLHVNAVLNQAENDEDVSLDDKRILALLSGQWQNVEKAKNFIFQLLRHRLFFDKYIIKRDKKRFDEGKWSLLRSKKYASKNSVYYVGTFNDSDDIDDEVVEEAYPSKESAKNLLALQAALRITYTSSRTMHWITILLRACAEGRTHVDTLLHILETYAVSKIKSCGYRGKNSWTEYQRILFAYLDYVLYRDGYTFHGKTYIKKQPDFEFQYRSSIEHFYPQHPLNHQECPPEILHSFGNLALIDVSGNSKVSNLDPVSKKAYGDVIKQSLKLQIMAEMLGNDSEEWINLSKGADNVSKVHEREMFTIFDREIESHKQLCDILEESCLL